jgi:ubiquinone/menaquinone biosynthesis C-methylase UbiE
MNLSDKHLDAVARSQESAYAKEEDYAVTPHIRHAALRRHLDDQIHAAVQKVLTRQPSCAVVEVGAGHGSFTETVLRAGGTPTITEMSKESFDWLQRKFSDVPEVKVVYDADGTALLRGEEEFDLILLISVIHHIPDYVGTVTALCDKVLRPGGMVLTFQDPLWYPRMSSSARTLSSLSYLAWRVTQGELRRGLRTRWRRLTGVYDDNEPSDMVEYHVVRQGVDEFALLNLFRSRFAEVELETYFSTAAPILQAVGDRHFPHNTFGILAQGHLAAEPNGI